MGIEEEKMNSEIEGFKKRFLATKTIEGLEALFKEDIWKRYPNILADKEMGRHAEKYYPMSEEDLRKDIDSYAIREGASEKRLKEELYKLLNMTGKEIFVFYRRGSFEKWFSKYEEDRYASKKCIKILEELDNDLDYINDISDWTEYEQKAKECIKEAYDKFMWRI